MTTTDLQGLYAALEEFEGTPNAYEMELCLDWTGYRRTLTEFAPIAGIDCKSTKLLGVFIDPLGRFASSPTGRLISLNMALLQVAGFILGPVGESDG